MKANSLERTFADKVFAICDYYLMGSMPPRQSRHIYDLSKLLDVVDLDAEMLNLIGLVKAQRAGAYGNPSASEGVDLASLLEEIKNKEGKKMLEKVKPGDFVIALDLNQKEYTSEEFSSQMERWLVAGGSSITFLIGGSLGLSEECKKRANVSVSFGKMTFPHQLARVMLLEQIYRSFKIAHHEPYHK